MPVSVCMRVCMHSHYYGTFQNSQSKLPLCPIIYQSGEKVNETLGVTTLPSVLVEPCVTNTWSALSRKHGPEGKSVLVPEKHKWCYVSIKMINSATQAIWPPVWLCPEHTLWTLHSPKWRKRHLWGTLSTFCHKKSTWISSCWRCFTVLSHFNSDDDWWQPNWPQWSNSLHTAWCRTKQGNVPRTKPVSLACQVIWEVHCVGLVSCKKNLKQRAVPDTFHPPPPPPHVQP